MITRTLHLDGQELVYLLRRSDRRSIGLKIAADGLTVTLPRRLPASEADRAVRQKLSWILDKLSLQQQQPRGRQFADGARVLWQGGSSILRTGHRQNRIAGTELHLAAVDDHEEIADALMRLCQREARSHFTERVRHWSRNMGLVPSRLALSSARGRWGSCSASGGLRLNWRLMQAPLEVIDYVVIHELAHLAELNHSARFWAIVAAHCPDWKAQRDWLKCHGRLLMDW